MVGGDPDLILISKTDLGNVMFYWVAGCMFAGAVLENLTNRFRLWMDARRQAASE